MKFHTVVHLVYNLRTCMKEDNPGPKISRKIIICAAQRYPFWFYKQF